MLKFRHALPKRARSSSEPLADALTPQGPGERRYENALVACARWEERYIAEWLTYHRHIGFDHVYLYCNDDDPAALYEAVLPFLQGAEPFVDFHHFGIQGLQGQMYLHFLRNFSQACERFMFLDIDEFLILKNRSLSELEGALPDDFGAILFNWVWAGNSGFKTRPPGPVWSNYNRRKAGVATLTKCIINSDKVLRPVPASPAVGFWHNPIEILQPDATLFNVLKSSMDDYYDAFPKSARDSLTGVEQAILDTAFVYHVGFKSEDDLRIRVERGLGGDFDGQVFWGEMQASGDDKVQAFMSQLNAEEELGLQEVWADILKGARAREIVPPPPGPNIAIGKPTLQSSVPEDAKSASLEEDARALVNGRPRGFFQNHTALEPEPWWQVDLERDVAVREIRIFNRLDAPERFTRLQILSSKDGEDWETVFAKDDEKTFGGADGAFFAWRPDDLHARFLRIQALGTVAISLDQVEVYSD